MKIVQIKNDGNMVELDVQFTVKNIRKVMREITKVKKILNLYSWTYGNSTVLCYGCLEGKAGKENKHELPPSGVKLIENIDNSDTQLLYNDIFVVRVEHKKYLNLDVSDYGLFYNLCFEGFDDCNSDVDNSSEASNESGENLNEFIVNDDTSSLNSDYELDEDFNVY